MSRCQLSMSTHAAGNLDLAWTWTWTWIWRGWKRDDGNFLCPVAASNQSQKRGRVPGVGSPIKLPVGEGRRELSRGAGAETTSRCGWQHLEAREVLFGASSTEAFTSSQGHRGTGSKLQLAKAWCGLGLSNQIPRSRHADAGAARTTYGWTIRPLTPKKRQL